MIGRTLAIALYDSIGELIKKSDLSPHLIYGMLYDRFSFLLHSSFLEEQIQINSMYGKISYLSRKYNIRGGLLFHTHSFRRANEGRVVNLSDSRLQIEQGIYIVTHWIKILSEENIPSSLGLPDSLMVIPKKGSKRKLFEKHVEVYIIDLLLEEKLAIAKLNDGSDQEVTLKLSVPNVNEHMNGILHLMNKYAEWPMKASLLDVNIEDEVYTPSALVLDPDYLIDVTSISETFKRGGTSVLTILGRKFIPIENSPSLALGNIANLMLDQLIYNPSLSFEDISNQVFRMSPLSFCLFQDNEVRQLFMKVQEHFTNIKNTIEQVFPKQGIYAKDVYVEPSFYSSRFGIQGRLDLFHTDLSNSLINIVELKSGKPFMPNSYGLNMNHYVQTLLYHYLIENTHKHNHKILSYILYSSITESALKFAPPTKAKFHEAINSRNRIRLLESFLCKIDSNSEEWEGLISSEKIPSKWKFVKRDIRKIEKVYQSLNEIEKTYVRSFIEIISKEREIAKKGRDDQSSSNGFAALWSKTLESKRSGFTILPYLKIVQNDADKEEPVIHLKYSKDSTRLSRFRIGDIAVFVPHDMQGEILDNQIFKCSIIDLSDQVVSIRLRARQENLSFFASSEFWHLEPDLLDSSFNYLFQGLYLFMQAKPTFRKLILGLSPPNSGKTWDVPISDTLHPSQRDIVKKALESEDYFLIWGPPGTGKTQRVLSQIVLNLIKHTEERILLLSFTNRAVDEICDSLENEGLLEHTVRFGSRFSSKKEYKNLLFNEQISHVNKRSELHSYLHSKRIYVSTVASISGKKELFKLLRFDTILVDEASQILEPAIIGLLSKAKRFILIGDHKQLPAVCTLNHEETIAKTILKEKIGLTQLSNSLFERLYSLAQINKWSHAYGQLSFQGRMHQDIMAFINKAYYEDNLHVIPSLHRLVQRRDWQSDTGLELQLASHRLIFFPVNEIADIANKGNIAEANACALIVENLQSLLSRNNIEFSSLKIGIITPFRIQISYIQQALSNKKLLSENIAIDTVERFQGGSMDYVIYSTAVNNKAHLHQISKVDENNLDRKLNVAITRAKESFIMVGNEKVLTLSQPYHEFIRSIYIGTLSE